MNLKSIKARIILIPALAVGALFAVGLFDELMENRLAKSELRADIGREIAHRMSQVLSDEQHYYHHVKADYLIDLRENNSRISGLIISLGNMKNSLSMDTSLASLERSFISNRNIFTEVSKTVTDTEREKHELARIFQDLNIFLSNATETIAQDETRLIMEGKYQYNARKEFGSVLKELLGYSAAVILNITNLLVFDDEEAFKADENRLSERTRPLIKAGSALSRVTRNPQDMETWKVFMSRTRDIDALRKKLSQYWKERVTDSVILESSGEEVIIKAERIRQIALADFKSLIRMRSNVDTIFMIAAGFFVIVLSYFLSRSIGISLNKLRVGTEAIARGNLEHRTLIDTDDELGDLSRAFDSMAGKLSTFYRELEQEIDHRKAIQETLEASEEKYRDLFEHIQDPIIIIDLKTFMIEDINQVAMDTFGYTREEFTRLKVGDLATGDEREKVIRNVENFANEKMVSKQVFSRNYVRKDGTTFPSEVTASGITIGGSRKLVGSIRDVSERKKLEAHLQHTEKLESLGILAGGIAHDFNNILMGVMGHAGLALMKLAEDSPAVDNVRNIETAAQRLGELTDQLLAYSGRGKFESTLLDLTALVEEMSSLLAAALPKEVEIRYVLSHDTPAFKGDSSQIRQVVMNLITNAAEAALESKGTVSISTGTDRFSMEYLAESLAAPELQPGEYVYLTVSDTGPGMDNELITRIFDPFFTTKDSGRGLGLAAVIGIVNGHEGALMVESETGEGTTFTVLLPVAEGKPVTTGSGETTPIEDSSTWSILVVDDEEVIRNVAVTILEMGNMKVLTATNGREAVEIYRSDRDAVDLVLLDLSMPVMGGRETYLELKKMDPHIRVLFSSGYGESESIDAFSEDDGVAFIKKPYSPEDLMSKVREVMGKGKSSNGVAG